MMIFPIPIITPMLFGGGGGRMKWVDGPLDLLMFGASCLCIAGALSMLGVLLLHAADWLPLVPPRPRTSSYLVAHYQFHDTMILIGKWGARTSLVLAASLVTSAAVWKLRRIIARRA